MILSHQSRQEVQWWLDKAKKINGNLIRPEPVSFWLETDASLKGWGSCFRNLAVNGRWSEQESMSY